MRKSVFILLFTLTVFSATAQEETSDYYNSERQNMEIPDVGEQKKFAGETAFSVIDTSFFEQRYFLPRDSVQAWAGAKQYSKIADAEEQLRKWKASQTKEIPRRQKSSSTWINNLFTGNIASGLLWILAAIFVGYILYKLILNKGLFTRNNSRKIVEKVELTDDELFLKQDFASLIKSFEEKQDLRSAMRYNFLYTLNKLKERGLIEFQIEKTNKKYIVELDAKFKQDFAKLARYYEYAWYGNINFNADDYQLIKTSFQKFNSKI